MKDKVETMICVKVCGKTVRARLDTGSQDTRVCPAVAELEMRTGTGYRKVILREAGNLKMVRRINLKLNTRARQQVTVDAIIDQSIQEKIVVLGMLAMQAFGFKCYVGGQEAQIRTAKEEKNPRGKTAHPRSKDQTPKRSRRREEADERDRDDEDYDDRMSFLDEEEARMILDMQRRM